LTANNLFIQSLFITGFLFPDFHADLCEWGPIYTLWANSEDQLVSSLLSMSKAVETASQSLKELVSSNNAMPHSG